MNVGTGSNGCWIQSGGGVHSNAFAKTGGTNSQFLKADGTVDTSTYLTNTAAGATYATVALVTPLTVATQNQTAVSGYTTFADTVRCTTLI